MSRRSRSTSDPAAQGPHRVPDREPHPWLQEQVYAPKCQRTVDLVTRAIDALVAEHRARPSTTRISLSTIVARTKQLDPTGQGVSQTAILGNTAARAYYEQHRTTIRTTARTAGTRGRQGTRTHRRSADAPPGALGVPVMRVDRDLARVRQRYRRLSKAELVERVVAAEQAQARQHALWLAANDQLLTWQLRAEEAERRLHAQARPPTPQTTRRKQSDRTPARLAASDDPPEEGGTA